MSFLGWKIDRDKGKTTIPDTVGELLGESRLVVPPLPANATRVIVLFQTPDGRHHIVAQDNVDIIAVAFLRTGYNFHVSGGDGDG